MAITNASQVVPFDGDDVVRAVREASSGTVQSIVEAVEAVYAES
jgi:hypothetical protein